MRKCILLILTSLTLSLALIACSSSINNGKPSNTSHNKNESNTTQKEPQYDISEFMPQELNLKIDFSGGFENGGETSYIEYIKGNRVQIRTANGGTIVVTVLEKKDNSIMIVYKQAESYEKKNVIDETSENSEVYLMGPIKVGTNWKTIDGTTKTITSIDTELNTKAGKFKCVEVTSEGKDFVYKEYFTPKLGRISSIFTTNGDEFKTEIKSLEKNSPYK